MGFQKPDVEKIACRKILSKNPEQKHISCHLKGKFPQENIPLPCSLSCLLTKFHALALIWVLWNLFLRSDTWNLYMVSATALAALAKTGQDGAHDLSNQNQWKNRNSKAKRNIVKHLLHIHCTCVRLWHCIWNRKNMRCNWTWFKVHSQNTNMYFLAVALLWQPVVICVLSKEPSNLEALTHLVRKVTNIVIHYQHLIW